MILNENVLAHTINAYLPIMGFHMGRFLNMADEIFGKRCFKVKNLKYCGVFESIWTYGSGQYVLVDIYFTTLKNRPVFLGFFNFGPKYSSVSGNLKETITRCAAEACGLCNGKVKYEVDFDGNINIYADVDKCYTLLDILDICRDKSGCVEIMPGTKRRRNR